MRSRTGGGQEFLGGLLSEVEDVMQVTDFINRLTRINSGNIGTFMETAAIGTAYIGNAAVGTLQVAGGAITTMQFGRSGAFGVPAGGRNTGAGLYMQLPAGASGVTLFAGAEFNPPGGDATVGIVIRRNGMAVASSSFSARGGWTSQIVVTGFDQPGYEGTFLYEVEIYNASAGPGANQALNVHQSYITGTGGKR